MTHWVGGCRCDDAHRRTGRCCCSGCGGGASSNASGGPRSSDSTSASDCCSGGWSSARGRRGRRSVRRVRRCLSGAVSRCRRRHSRARRGGVRCRWWCRRLAGVGQSASRISRGGGSARRGWTACSRSALSAAAGVVRWRGASTMGRRGAGGRRGWLGRSKRAGGGWCSGPCFMWALVAVRGAS